MTSVTDFLQEHDAPQRHGTSRARRIAVWSAGVFGALVLLTSPVWFLGGRAAFAAMEGRSALLAAQSAAERLDLRGAEWYLTEAETEFGAAARDLRRLAFLNGIPGAGPRLRAAERLLSSGALTVSAARDVLAVGAELLAVAAEQEGDAFADLPVADAGRIVALLHDLTPEQKRRMLASFAADAERLGAAAEKIDAALAAFDAVDAEVAPKAVRDLLQPTRLQLVRARDGLRAAAPLAATVPSVLGYPEPRHYLFFFQNNTELRPTGGFLGVVGMATVADAELVELTTDDVYAFDGPSEAVRRPEPPAPLRKYLGVPQWYLRDANWSPDFTVSAEVMRRFFLEEAAVALGPENVPPVDGIIAVTPNLAEDILRLTGPVAVRGITFTAENVVDELEYQVEIAYARQGIASEDRKGILAELTDAVAEQVLTFPLQKLLETVRVVHRNLQEGHILLAMDDPAAQRIILEHDWGGALRPVAGDYLMVVDANLASLKSDPAVQRSIAYSIQPDGDGFVGTVAITYDHRGSFDWKTTRYRTYTRVYVPAGTELLGVAGAMENDRILDPARRPGTADVTDELGRRAFGAFIAVEPRERRTLTFRFRLSEAVTRDIQSGFYGLTAEKQPGTTAVGLTLDLDLGKNVTSAVPAEHPSQYGDTRYRFETDLRTDQYFTVGL